MLSWSFVCTAFFISALIWARRYYAVKKLYPPSPPPKSIISGNTKDFTNPSLWRVCAEWAKTYGDILYLRVFTKSVLVLNSLEDANNLLARRSHNYSARPMMPMYTLMGFSFSTAIKPYGVELRHHRRIFEQSFKHDAALAYRHIQTEKMMQALHGLLISPANYQVHIKTYASSIIMSVMYGYDVKSKDDRFVLLSEASDVAFSQGTSPKWIINAFPFMRFVPSWFPGGAFQAYAESIRLVVKEQQTAPYQYVMNSVAAGDIRPCVVGKTLEKCLTEGDHEMLRQVAASGYGAAVGTTTSSIVNFLIAMITYPDIQKRAQQEIDAVTGGVRLPEFGDQVSLPYIEAIYREVVRWLPIVPLGLPHASQEDDVYNGYYIPKDTMILPNVWAMTRNGKTYKDPETFNPDRFFSEDGELNNDHIDYAFGFGRRICPGQHLAAASIWIAIATILSAFDIGEARDESGNLIPFAVNFTESGLLNYPLSFECSITPRSEKSRQLVLEAHKFGIHSRE